MRKLGRYKSDREHMLRNLATSLVLYEQVETTEAKAKEVKPFLDKILVRAKKADLNAIRFLYTVFFDKNALDKTAFAAVLAAYYLDVITFFNFDRVHCLLPIYEFDSLIFKLKTMQLFQPFNISQNIIPELVFHSSEY